MTVRLWQACRDGTTLIRLVLSAPRGQPNTVGRADAARDSKDYLLAAEIYESVLDSAPNDAAIHVQAGHMYKEAGRLRKAEGHYLIARTLMPEDADLHLQLGHFYKVMGSTADAAEYYEKAERLRPGWAPALSELANLGTDRVAVRLDEHRSAPVRTRHSRLSRMARPVRKFCPARLTAIATFLNDIGLVANYAAQLDIDRVDSLSFLRRLVRIARHLLGRGDQLQDVPLFSQSAYRAAHRGLSYWDRAGIIHYIRYGEAQGWSMHPLFDPVFYQSTYPEVAASHLAPVIYYLKLGAGKGHDPHPLFDVKYYLESCPVGTVPPGNALLAYLASPRRSPHPLFDAAYYAKSDPGIRRSGLDPLVDYLIAEHPDQRDPHPLFDSRFYCRTYANCMPERANPLSHYVTTGAPQGFWPNPRFDGGAYRRRYPETACPRVNALAHFLSHPGTDVRPLILMIDSAYPRPDRDSGSIDQIMYMQMFQELGYRVAFAAEGEFAPSEDRLDELEKIWVCCVTSPSYPSILAYLSARSAEIAVCFLSRVNFGANYLSHVRELCPHAKVIFNTVDLHHLRELREAELTNDAPARARALATRDVEFTAITHTEATIVVSDKEAQIVRDAIPSANLFVIPLVRDAIRGPVAHDEARADIAFIGGFHHLPNVDAVHFFLDAIWPTVRPRLPHARFFVIGPDLPVELTARVDPGVTWIGHVPDLDPWFRRLRLTVAPLRYGAGAKGKVVSSLAQGVPCVMSSMAAEGMRLIDGTHADIADSPDEAAERIVRLYTDLQRWRALSDAGIQHVRTHHSRANGVRVLAELLQSIGMPQATGPANPCGGVSCAVP